MITAVVAAAVALGVGPWALLLANRTANQPQWPAPVADAAIIASAGLAATVVLFTPTLAVVLPLAVLGCAAALVDAREGRLPDLLTGPVLVATIVLVVITDRGDAVRILLAAAVVTVVAAVLKMVFDATIGWGDVKLVPSLAVVLVQHGAVGPGLVSIAGLVLVTAAVIGRRGGLVPYGPAMVFGTLGVVAAL